MGNAVMGQWFNAKSWDLLWFRMGALVPPSFSLVQDAYTEPHRHYHTFDHINACLGHLEQHADLAENLDAVEYAIWMHDVVYDTHASDNEAQSADLAVRLLKDSGAKIDAELVRAMIMATQHHNCLEANDIALVCDLDLSVLALPSSEYARYVEAVRAEYAWVPEPFFNESRGAFLRRTLEQPTLFQHSRLAARWDQRARENLTLELADIKRNTRLVKSNAAQENVPPIS
jgi:predicted metal-dependent HD superfamily phosphohydrolase